MPHTDTTTYCISQSAPRVQFWIGSSGYDTADYDPPEDGFVGKIDEVAYWNVALTLSEIQDIYNATEAGKTAELNEMANPPAAWYRMGD